MKSGVKDVDEHFRIFLRVKDGCDRNAKVGCWTPEICRVAVLAGVRGSYVILS